MAILYKANETQFNHLGLGPLNDAISILVTEERNGIFELEMKYPVSGKVFHELKNDRIIKADAGHKLKDQRFKIIRISKPLKGIVTVYAEHVSYLTQDLALKPKVSFNGNARQALEHWKANLVDDNPFSVWSDISTTGNIDWTIDEVENARRALGGVQGSILDVYGGEYQFDNYDIYLYQKRGVNSELLIAYGRNLVDLEQEEEIANTYTSIYPYSIYTDDDGNERMVTLPEYYIDSEHVDKYARRKILVVDFTTDEIETVSALRSAARRYIKDNDVGVPKVNLKIQYVDLAKTLDYKHLALYEEVNLCDNVKIYFEKYDINTTAKVIKVVWDVLNERYDSIEVGEARASLSQAIDTVVDGKVHSVEKLAMQTLRTADGKNTIYFGLEEPLATQYPLKKNDIWYRIVDGEFTRTYIYDGVVWQLVIDMDSQEAKEEARQAQERADDAVNRANQSTQLANNAIAQAQAGFDLAQENALELETLGLRFNDVEGNLTTISGTVDGLQTTVSDVQGNVSNLTQLSNTLQTRLSDAEGNINELTLTSQSMQSTISSLQDEWDNLEIGGRNFLLNTTTESLTLDNPNSFDTVSINGITVSPNFLESAKGKKVTISIEARSTGYEKGTSPWIGVECVYYQNDGTTRYITVQLHSTLDTDGEWRRYSRTVSLPLDISSMRNSVTMLIRNIKGFVQTKQPKLEIGNKATDWSPAPEDMATQTQITQLSDAINLRVAKGDVINQINLDTSGVLISGKKLILDGDTTVTGQFKVDNANIKSIDAGKVTVGDLVGHSLVGGSVIGGYIEQQSGNRRLEMYNGIIDSFYNGQLAMRFGQYSLEFYNKANDPIGRIRPIISTDGESKRGLGFIVDNDILNIGFEKGGLYRGILRADIDDAVTTLSGPYNNLNSGSTLRLFANRRAVSEDRFSTTDQPAIILDQSDSTNNIDIYYGGYNRRKGAEVRFRHRTSADASNTRLVVHNQGITVNNNYLDIGRNSSDEPQFRANAIRRRTSTNDANVRINPDSSSLGLMFRTTSSIKHKINIEEIPYEHALKVLDLTPSTWYDKNDCETYSEYLSCGDRSLLADVEPIRRIPGLIAEDVERAGLHEFVEYANDEIVNINSKLWTLLIPITRQHQDDIEWLKIENQYLKQKVKILEEKVS